MEDDDIQEDNLEGRQEVLRKKKTRKVPKSEKTGQENLGLCSDHLVERGGQLEVKKKKKISNLELAKKLKLRKINTFYKAVNNDKLTPSVTGLSKWDSKVCDDLFTVVQLKRKCDDQSGGETQTGPEHHIGILGHGPSDWTGKDRDNQ